MNADLLERLLLGAAGTCGLDPCEREDWWVKTFAPRLIALVAEESTKLCEAERDSSGEIGNAYTWQFEACANAIREAFKP